MSTVPERTTEQALCCYVKTLHKCDMVVEPKQDVLLDVKQKNDITLIISSPDITSSAEMSTDFTRELVCI